MLRHYLNAGEPEAGLPCGRESVELARRLGDDVLLARGMISYLLTVDPARHVQLVGEAIACTERSGDHQTNFLLHNNAGGAALEAGDIRAARAHLEAAAQASQQIEGENTVLTINLGLVLRAEGDPDGARSTDEAALRTSRRNGNSIGMAAACHGWARLAGDAGDVKHRAAVLHMRRAGISRPDRPSSRHARPPGEPRPSARAPGR